MHSFVKRWWPVMPAVLLVAVLWPAISGGQVAPPQEPTEITPVEPVPPLDVDPPAQPPEPPAELPPDPLQPPVDGVPPQEPPIDQPPPVDQPPVRQPRPPRGTDTPPVAGQRDYVPDPRFPDVDPRVTLRLDIAESIDIRLLVDVVAEELRLNFLYDDLQGPITLKPQTEITRAELYNLLERALQLKGFSMISVEQIGRASCRERV